MFTGLIQKLGTLETLRARGEGARLEVSFAPWEEPLRAGESVAVSGVCLTVCDAAADRAAFDVLEETLRRTNLGSRRRGDRLNLERSLRPADRLGGHFVTGHVDGLGTVTGLSPASKDWALDVRCSAELRAGLCPKGSVACDGVSLTVAELRADGFRVYLIPATWNGTAFASTRAGDSVNLETDLLGKYVRAALEAAAPGSRVTPEGLARAGFA